MHVQYKLAKKTWQILIFRQIRQILSPPKFFTVWYYPTLISAEMSAEKAIDFLPESLCALL